MIKQFLTETLLGDFLFENDIWTVCLIEGGDVRHFRSDQIKIHKNGTFDIIKLN
jgi:hypothetical protein